ncbi:MAG: hypothetical protein H0U74_13345 [Bradymonadaceae bacterium]|nr:hypothetical protein [Lujinxingiaceae bacterium]
MSLNASIADERALSRELFVLIAGGVTAGIVTSGLNIIAGQAIPQLMVLAFGAIIGLFANLSDSKSETSTLRLVLALLGGITWALLVPFSLLGAAAAGGLLIGMAMSLGYGANLVERAMLWGFYGLAMGAAVFTSETLFNVGFLGAFNGPVIGDAITGGLWGLFLCVATGLKHMRFERDLVDEEFQDAIRDVGALERPLLESASLVYGHILRELERADQRDVAEHARNIATETSRSLVALARRTDELRRAMAHTARVALDKRIEQLDKRIADAEDATVKRELRAAREELADQLSARKRIDVACARLEARQQRCMTALERLHVVLIQNSSIGPDHVGLQDALESLQMLSDDIRWKDLSAESLGIELESERALDEVADDDHLVETTHLIDPVDASLRDPVEDVSLKEPLHVEEHSDAQSHR